MRFCGPTRFQSDSAWAHVAAHQKTWFFDHAPRFESESPSSSSPKRSGGSLVIRVDEAKSEKRGSQRRSVFPFRVAPESKENHNCDEFPVGHSLGCPPAQPASALPTGDDSQKSTLPYNHFSAYGNYPLNFVSQSKGALQKNGVNPYSETVFAATLPRPTITPELRKITGPNCPIGPVWPAKLRENRSTSDKSELATLTPLISARLNLRHRVFRACLITKALTLK